MTGPVGSTGSAGGARTWAGGSYPDGRGVLMGVYAHILVGVDGSDASAEAATTAGRLAADLDAKVTAVYVRQLPATVPPFGVSIDLGSYWEELERLAGERAAAALDPTGAPWRFEVRTGDPSVQLERSADE